MGEILRLVIKHTSHSEDDEEKTISSRVNELSKVTGILHNKVYSRVQFSEFSRLCTPGNARAGCTRASDKALSPASFLPKRWPVADPALFWLWVGGIIIAIL